MSDSMEEAIATLEIEIEKAKARVQIKDKCLRLAMKTLNTYAPSPRGFFIAKDALGRIKEMLIEIDEHR